MNTELRDHYFAHYDKLKPIDRESAKANWDKDMAVFNHPPATIASAIMYGLNWTDSPQGFTYWSDLYDSLWNGSYSFTKKESEERMATEADWKKLEEIAKEAMARPIFPKDDAERQKYAVGTFICEFFPHAIAELARFSYEMQQKHNPDAPMGWAKDKSVGDGNQIFRHQMDGEYREVAWRGLEQLERSLTKMPPFDK